MHSAPSVSYPVGRSRLARRILWGAWALGAATLAAWCLQFEGALWRTAVLVAAVALAALAARRAVRLGEGAFLHWDGRHWSSTGSVSLREAAASVHLDLQSLVLVRLQQPGGSPAWLWADREWLPGRWLDVRRALEAGASLRAEASMGVPQP